MTVERIKLTRGYSFWKRVLDYAKHQCRERWEFQDRKCPHCNTWASEVGGFSTRRPDQLAPYDDIMSCSQCDKDSLWRNEGICAWTVDEQGRKTQP